MIGISRSLGISCQTQAPVSEALSQKPRYTASKEGHSGFNLLSTHTHPQICFYDKKHLAEEGREEKQEGWSARAFSDLRTSVQGQRYPSETQVQDREAEMES